MEIDQLISDFSPENLILFFRQKMSSFKPDHEDYFYLFNDANEINENYKEINKLGEADLENADDLLVLTAKTLAP